ncbi:discoidin domain-containing protein [Pseudomonas sp. WS 5013]|uniref:discoidin domain-containing protein n=1 Tax=Pseudomonas sp. WS 5013 TaxID=2717475 RepID=UPI001473BDE0|nr:discoidin domain-containing protein [Pseudomonas sp. WS 5013]NMY40564.1 discoidin domain-containing protein [Pseudomonas sp. WS 5013]
MANQIGTASNLEDLFGKILTFLTSNANLVSAGQAWQALRVRRDNLQALTTNLTEPATANYRKTIHTCRYDPRSLNTNSPAATRQTYFNATNNANGTSYVQMQLRQARAVAKVRLRAPQFSTDVGSMLRNFRLQYSDDGTSWTTALTVSTAAVYSQGEWRDFAVPGTPGSHLYWRIIIDSVQGTASVVAWSSMLLLEADGTVANHFGSEMILKGTGLGGADEIFVGIRSEYDAAAGWFNLFLNGYSGFDPNEQSWFDQPGALPGYSSAQPLAVPMVPCWDTTMPFWFVASGRSFRFAVKVSTSYEGGYLGFVLPYATPGQYPYPLAVGGSLCPQDTNRSAEWRYSYADWRHGVFPGPGAESVPNAEGRWATLYLRTPSGQWAYFANRPNAGTPQPQGIYGPAISGSAPYAASGGWRSVWPHCMNDQWSSGCRPYRECLGGGYMLQRCVLLQRGPAPTLFGEFEGVYSISGYQNAPENTTVVGGVPAVVFQNAYRNTVHEFWALSLD